MNQIKYYFKNQGGFVSFIVTMVLIFVMTLAVISFSRVSQRNQRQALDRQLTTQAFYAAETGVNDAVDLLQRNPELLTQAKTECDWSGAYSQSDFSSVLDASAGVEYTCLLIDPSPSSIVINPIESGSSRVTTVASESEEVINSITVGWSDGSSSPTSNFSGCADNDVLPGAWDTNCSPGMIRVELMPINTSPDFRNQQMVFFAKPVVGGVSSVNRGDIVGSSKGNILRVDCSTSSGEDRDCKIQINDLGVFGANQFAINVKALYKPANLLICSPECNTTSSIRLTGSQVLIDSTGKANDVLRRIQVRVNIEGSDVFVPSYAIESAATVCKLHQLVTNQDGDVIEEATTACHGSSFN